MISGLIFIIIIVILIPLCLAASSADGCYQKYLVPESTSSLWLNRNSENRSVNDPVAFSTNFKIPEKQKYHLGLRQFIEVCFLTVTAYHAQAMPHELVHMATAYSFGTKTKKWGVGPVWQYVEYEKDDEERRRSDVFFTSMSAPVFSRSTCDLPRWIRKPEGPGLWLRWTSAYWYMSYSTTWVTLVGTWIAHIKGDSDAGYDFNSASRAFSKKRSNRTIFLGALTAVMAFDAYFTKDHIIYNCRTLLGMESRKSPENQKKMSLHFLPNRILLSYTFL
jgi:hypothetical protein